MDCRYANYNPYDLDKLKLNNKKSYDQIAESRISRSSTQKEREHKSDLNENFIFRKKNSLDYSSNLNNFQKFYYKYLSISINFFVLAKNKSLI